MTVNDLIAELGRIRDKLGGGEWDVMGNDPHDGFPWGDIMDTRITGDPPRVIVYQGVE